MNTIMIVYVLGSVASLVYFLYLLSTIKNGVGYGSYSMWKRVVDFFLVIGLSWVSLPFIVIVNSRLNKNR